MKIMNRGQFLDSIPNDIIPDILSRLPAKSVSRFRCVSKLWASILCRQDFNELFLARSSSRPHLLIVVEQGGEWSFFSSPQPQNDYEKSSLVVAADFHTKFSNDRWSYCGYAYASGLIYFPNMRFSKDDVDEVRVICNPSTGQFAILPPDLKTTFTFGRPHRGFLGFDPIGKQFKVLVYNHRDDDELVYQILTLGTENVRWREIICPLTCAHRSEQICINGVLYYVAFDPDEEYVKIGYFDVRSEEFKFICVDPDVIDYYYKMINYKGKLCLVGLKYASHGGFPLELLMWVLEDVDKHEWTPYVYTLRAQNTLCKVKNNVYTLRAQNTLCKVKNNLSVVGMTASGEIVLAKNKAYKPFYVFYFNPERNTLRSVEIQGVREEEEWFNDHRVYYFVDHVEDLRLDVMKKTYAATPISLPEQHINII